MIITEPMPMPRLPNAPGCERPALDDLLAALRIEPGIEWLESVAGYGLPDEARVMPVMTAAGARRLLAAIERAEGRGR